MASKFDPLLGRMRTVDEGQTTIEKHFSGGGGGGGEGTTLHSGLTDVTADQHHAESHTLASHSSKAHSDLTGIGTDDHHAKLHGHDGADGSGTVSYDDLSDLPTLVTDHGALTGLSDDDHTGYALLAGRAGGQILKGGTNSGDDLTLQSTNHATKGSILFGTSAYDEVNNFLGIGITSPLNELDIRNSTTNSQAHFSGTGANTGGYLTTTTANNFFGSSGAKFISSAWEARATTGVIFGGSAGNFQVFANSGLTQDVTFTPIERLRVSPTAITANLGALDYDFNIKGDNDVNAFYLDASTDSIGLGTATPDSKLEINHDISALHGLTIQTTNNTFTNGGPFSFRIQTSSAVNRALMNNYGQAAFNYASAATGNAATISNAGSIRTLQGTNTSISADPGVQIAAIYAGTDKGYVSIQQATALHTQFRVNNSGSTDNGLNAAAYYFAEIQGSSVVANLYAQYNHARNSSSGTSTNMTAVNVLMDFPAASTGAVTNAYGFRINVGGGAGTKPANALGLDILDVTGGTSTNFAIRTNAGNVVFNEGGDANTDFRVESDNNTHQLFVDASADAVGIDQSSPTALLHIGAGSATANTAPLKFTSGTLTTTAEVGAQEYNGNFYQTKVGVVRYGMGGTLFDKFSDTGSVGTTETDLQTNTLAANTFNANGDKVIAEYGGSLVASGGTASRRIRVYFGGTEIANSGALLVAAASSWRITVFLIRVSATVVRYTIHLSSSDAALVTTNIVGEVTGLTLSNTNILKVTGQAGGVGAANNDIVLKAGRVEFQAAA